ncbi:hypothetical protein TNCV_3589691 [Trichonephila clavipes]|nr:hypothetical protein TNCV_3589691 [Trichonephila clavipes]
MLFTTFKISDGIKGNRSEKTSHRYNVLTSIKTPTTDPTPPVVSIGFWLTSGKLECDQLEAHGLQRGILIQSQC